MSIRVMAMVWEQSLPPGEKFLLLALADHARDDGSRCYPSVDRLRRKCSCSERTVQRLLRKLEREGLIVVVANRCGGRGKATEYRIQVEKLDTYPSVFQGKGDNATPFSESEHANGDIDARKGDVPAAKGCQLLAPQPKATVNKHQAHCRRQQSDCRQRQLADDLTRKRIEGLKRKINNDTLKEFLDYCEKKNPHERYPDWWPEVLKVCKKLNYTLDETDPLVSSDFVNIPTATRLPLIVASLSLKPPPPSMCWVNLN